MTDREDPDFARLANALKSHTPAPVGDARAQALTAAQAAFAQHHTEKTSAKGQESVQDDRLISDRPFRRWIVKGRHMFGSLTSPTALGTGGAALAAGLAVVVLLPQDVVSPSIEPVPVLAPSPAEAPASPVPSARKANTANEARAVIADSPATMEDATTAPLAEAPAGLSALPSDGLFARQSAQSADHRAVTLPAPPMAEPTLSTQTSAESFPDVDPNPLRIAAEEPVSTFSIDVDTASWAILRSSLRRGQLPPVASIRLEEMVNYFQYDYPAPAADEAPFRPSVTLVQTPWNPETQLLRIALQGQLPAVEDRPPLNLVLLVDTSGSMQGPDRLPLLQTALKVLLPNLRPEDDVAIVTYAGQAGVALEPTSASDRNRILDAIDGLTAEGSTAGESGLDKAYALAADMAEDGEVSRVLLATDGDFNVGLSDPSALKDYIAEQRSGGAYLSVLGFGRGNLNDATMQALAQAGNGTAAYIDSAEEAVRVLDTQLAGALFPIADDVKVQVEFNPAEVGEYRLIGYETRALNREDFANDRVDAGEIGAGHQVTALYEVTPVGSPARLTEPLRYGAQTTGTPGSEELAFLRLRYKLPGERDSALIETPIATDLSELDSETAWAAAIAGAGQALQGSPYLGDWNLTDAIDLAQGARGSDPYGERAEALRLLRLAQSLQR